MSMIHEADNTLIKLLTLVTQSPPWGYIINIMPDVNLRPYLFMYYNGGKYDKNDTLLKFVSILWHALPKLLFLLISRCASHDVHITQPYLIIDHRHSLIGQGQFCLCTFLRITLRCFLW